MAGKFKKGDVVRTGVPRSDIFYGDGLFMVTGYGYRDEAVDFSGPIYCKFVVSLRSINGSRLKGPRMYSHEKYLALDPFMTAAMKVKNAAQEG